MTSDPHILPPDLPVPVNDGAAAHLGHGPCRGFPPGLVLPSTDGTNVEPFLESFLPLVVFFYPRTGIPGQPPNRGAHGEEWDAIPGARGCTPQSCGFRDLHGEFTALGVTVYGMSTNSPAHQREFKERTHAPFEFLSDSGLELVRALRLPTFEFPVESGGPTTLIRRMAWYLEGGRIVKVWYPVFPPDRNAAEVLDWIRLPRAGRA